MTVAAGDVEARRLSIAFVLPYGEPADGFFPDTLLGLLCARARAAGHEGRVVRVYYDGRDAARDAEVRRRFAAWLHELDADLVVLDRLFDVGPIREHLAGRPGGACVMVSRGESFDPVDGVDYVIGLNVGRGPGGRTRRSPTIHELGEGFDALVSHLASAVSGPLPAGVTRFVDEVPRHGPPLPALRGGDRNVEAVLEQDVICLDEPPRIVRKTLFGNTGCPYAADPRDNPHFEGAELPELDSVTRLGCAFCSMGGDYQKRPDRDVVRELVAQALHHTRHLPGLEELVLSDQYALRYLARLVGEAHRAGVRPIRWLFAARADSFVRERKRVEAAIEAARETGHMVEVYLTGFEAFSDRELLRYNKGVTVAELVAAIDTMRELACRHPEAFAYSRARGHSLILWNPWTSPEDLRESLETVRAHGLMEVFDELGRNRLRLYSDLPIYYAAKRDGVLADSWGDADEGAGRRKGYNVEHPWRFREPATGRAHALAQPMRDALGAETEVAQLRAIVDEVAREDAAAVDAPAHVRAVLDDLGALDDVIQRLLRPGDRPGDAPKGRSMRAESVSFTGACNNGCAACAQRDSWLDDRPEALLRRVGEAREGGLPVVLAGREPTIHPAFLDLVRTAAGDDGRPVGVVTNGRFFAARGFAKAAVRAGLRGASVKVFAPDAETADAITRTPGAHAQALEGIRRLVATGRVAVEVRVPLDRRTLGSLEGYVDLARRLGASQLRVEVALDALGLANLEEGARALEALAARCGREGLGLEVSPLRAGTRAFRWLPGPS